ncbi:hypothetical protein BT93_L2302 [Corymbia citriodora subsp. variegata]|uniref:TFIIS N-terminal domain-containing protein n=1 Tax=Corymbia citriodora subsp. variegata TaxID=360336 RepID=A0A8T0CK00_CORYI|nr:hypothetical protein BT93_L2302 [Corymbia citriodora subsp. variegata]
MMTISMDILEKTKIGITLNCLRRKAVSTQIARLAHNITTGWKAMVEEICPSTEDIAAGNSNVDPRKLGEMYCADRPTSSMRSQNHPVWFQEKPSNKASSIANKNQRPNANQRQATVKDMSSSINSRKIPSNQTATWKSEKGRTLQNSNGIMGRNRLSTDRLTKINCLDKVAAEVKFKVSKRNLQECDQQAETAKRQRTVLASHKGPGAACKNRKNS